MRIISFKKLLLSILIFSIISFGLTGCVDIVIPATGTVYISIVNDDYWYDIYVDGVYQNETDGNGNLTITNVPVGNHFFEAYDTSWWNLYGSKNQYISSGANYVNIYVY